ncbi:MAG: hypothetical protein WC213_07155 [Arenimonas sp.]|jgi:tetratricopeptide (TPR) repeat protein
MERISNRLLFVISVTLCLSAASCGSNADPAQPPAATAPASAAAAATSAAAASAAPTVATAPADFNGRVQDVVDQLATELGDEQTKRYTAVLAEGGESPHAGLGLIAFLGQNLELATWLYGLGVQAEPGNDAYLNNFGLGLHEKALLKKPTSEPLLTLAKESFEKAVTLKPDNAVYQSNLGFAQLERWRSSADAATLQAAVDALKKSVALDAKSATAWAHLAEALAAQSDNAGARQALEKSRARGPFNGALMSTGLRMPAAVMDEFKKAGPACKVDFECKAKCPKSIIGQINFVTCEMEQSSAQMACDAGKPYANGFDCSEQIPEFGILIPGLNSGFSLFTPWGRLDMTVDGKGNVDYRFKASTSVGGVGIGATTRGSWSPESGFSSVEIKPGVSYNLVGGDAAKLMGEAKMGPASIAIEGDPRTGNLDIKLKGYGGTVFSH